MNERYNKILNLPHHVSSTRQPMSSHDRAAQFAPYSALSGYDDAVVETARLTDSRTELDEYEKERINAALTDIFTSGRPTEASITYFVPDKRKAGGKYITLFGKIEQIDEYERKVILTDGRSIFIDDISDIRLQN